MFIADEIAPRFDIPNAAEGAVIECFVRRDDALQSFTREVATGLADVSQDLERAADVAERIFASLNAALEANLSQEVEGYKPWSIASFQPKILARAVGAVEALDDFIHCGFGAPPLRSARLDWSSLQALQRFMYQQFQHEAVLSQASETPPSATFAAEVMHLPALKQGKGKKRPTHTLIMKDSKGQWIQALVSFNESNISTFLDCINENRWHDSRKFGDILEVVTRERFIDLVRRQRHANNYAQRLEFSRKFNRDLFNKSIGFSADNIVFSKRIDNLIYEIIIKKTLETDNTDSEIQHAAGSISNKLGDLSECVRANLNVIDKFAADNPGKPVSNLILDLFPELAKAQEIPRVTAPETPPAIWPDDRIAIKGVLENPPDFIKRNYAPWLGKGLTRADVRRLDKPLSTALDNWLRRNPMPDDLDLPTLKEQNSRWIERIEKEGLGAVVSGDGANPTLQDAQRLLSAKRWRERQ